MELAVLSLVLILHESVGLGRPLCADILERNGLAEGHLNPHKSSHRISFTKLERPRIHFMIVSECATPYPATPSKTLFPGSLEQVCATISKDNSLPQLHALRFSAKQSRKNSHPTTPCKSHSKLAQLFNRGLFASPPLSPTALIAPFAGKSTNGALAGPPPPLSIGLFIVGGLYCPLLAIGLGLPGAPILLVVSSCGFTMFGLGPADA